MPYGAIGLLAASAELHAQERYDDSPLRERVKLRLGGFDARNVSSTARIDHSGLGIGTLLELEEDLNVEDSATVFRLDGYYRFSRAHRLEWTYYSMKRNGSTGLSKDIRIGGVDFPVGLALDTELDVEVAEVGYVWSFINVEPYEFFLGAGLNVRDVTLTAIGTGLLTGIDRRYDDGGTLPTPTVTFGGRYNVADKVSLNFKTEAFSLRFEEQSGRLQDAYFLVEYDVTRNFGIGGGLNVFNLDLDFDVDDDFTGELRSSHRGILFYITGSF
ncbi:MAG TPA: hypothetical protein VF339_11560 [Gammaproteobacteria bacterium]